jgi:hypothetical protein
MNKIWIPVVGVAGAGLAALALLLPHRPTSTVAREISASSTSASAKPAAIPAARAASGTLASRASKPSGGFADNVDAAHVGSSESRRALEAWTQENASAALAWAARITDAAQRQQAQEIICLTLAQREPRRAVQTSIDTGLCDTDAGLLENLTAQWAASDFSAAHDWVREQEASDWRDDLVARVAFAGSQSDPASAAQLVVGEMAPGPKQNEAAISVLHQWALRDLDAAASWANAFPEGNLRTRALSEIECIRLSRQTAAAQP